MLLLDSQTKSKIADVSRFLSQATLGVNQRLLNHVTRTGIDTWLQNQFAYSPPTNDTFQKVTKGIWAYFRNALVTTHGEAAINGDGNNPALPYKWYFHMGWWHQTLNSQEHLLRQRVAQALSELLVISDKSSLELDAVGMASYYDLLYNHAFGSYADLLFDVALHPCMGVYLSHMNNRKADTKKNIHPDENFAREIMQLFTIGLYELNSDGSHKTQDGDAIPTYDNRDIRELARVFTGLTASSYQYEWNTSFWDSSYNDHPVGFEDGVEKAYKTVPFVNMVDHMVGDESYHDRGNKTVLGGLIHLPGNQDVHAEIRQTVEQLVAHPNTAPFVARHLISQLVSSNPSPEYIEAVATAFGTRGDLRATVEKVLTYPLYHPVMAQQLPGAARQGGKTVQPQKLKSPLLRATQILRAFDVTNHSKKLWLPGDDIQEMLQQHPLSAPTVFNFYKPNFTPHGPLEKAGIAAPEFELHTSATSISYVNLMYYWCFGDHLPLVSTKISSNPSEKNIAELNPDALHTFTADKLFFDFTQELELAENPEQHDTLIDRLSLLLTGRQNLPIKGEIKAAFSSYNNEPLWVVQTIVFLLSISPYFVIQEA